jgi:single-strand DNA-binding protein
MNSIKNSVRLVGNVGRDPQIMSFESGKKKATITLATSDNFKNAQGEWVRDTQWHQVIAWGRHANIIEKFVSKGKELALEGKLVHRSYTDKDGNTRYQTEVVMNELLMLKDSKPAPAQEALDA